MLAERKKVIYDICVKYGTVPRYLLFLIPMLTYALITIIQTSSSSKMNPTTRYTPTPGNRRNTIRNRSERGMRMLSTTRIVKTRTKSF